MQAARTIGASGQHSLGSRKRSRPLTLPRGRAIIAEGPQERSAAKIKGKVPADEEENPTPPSGAPRDRARRVQCRGGRLEPEGGGHHDAGLVLPVEEHVRVAGTHGGRVLYPHL